MAARSFALVMGVLLLVEGVWGFLSPVTFGVLETNPLHAIMGIGLGVAGLRMAGDCGSARRYCFWLGSLLIAMGGLALTPGFDTLMYVTLELNHVEAVFSVGAAVMALGIAYASRPQPVVLRLHSRDVPGYRLRTAPLFSISQSPRPGHASPL